MAADRVDLVDEDDGRRLRLGLLEQVTTRLAPTPTNISTKSEPEMLKNGTPASPATARASSVLPVPGGPNSSTPFGILAPMLLYLSGFDRKSRDLLQLLDGLVDAGDVVERDRGLVLRQLARSGLPELHDAAAALHRVDEVEEDTDEQQDRQQAVEQREPDALPLRVGVERDLRLGVAQFAEHFIGRRTREAGSKLFTGSQRAVTSCDRSSTVASTISPAAIFSSSSEK